MLALMRIAAEIVLLLSSNTLTQKPEPETLNPLSLNPKPEP